ncbi:MAG TPA: hypothetical protein VJ850_00775 [Candidatus Limnocylindrales bacterium]|nr:hypothetical protein [Candidatus Limnocylindrales bacterium]
MHHRSTLLLLAGLLLAGCQAVQPQPSTTLPPANAQPGDVAAAYLQALVDGDCAKARALMTSDALALAKPMCDRPRVTGYSELSRDAALPNGRDITYVVELTIKNSDGFDGGHTMFVGVSLTPGGYWRVNGIGSGP